MTSQSKRPTSVNLDLVGRTYGPATYEVAAVKLREFAQATGASNPIYFEREVAQREGYRDVVATPTFAVVPAQAAEAAYISDPASGIDFTRVVHADEAFTHIRPIVAGDVLSTTVEVTNLVDRGPLTLVTTTARIHDADDDLVCVVTSTLAVRGQ